MASAPSSFRLGRLAAALFGTIVLLAVGALALTQELRSRPDVVNTIKKRGEAIVFSLTEHEPDATVAIIGKGGAVVAEPIAHEPIGPGRVEVDWDREIDGSPAPPGTYRVRFTLRDLDREAFLPREFRIREEAE